MTMNGGLRVSPPPPLLLLLLLLQIATSAHALSTAATSGTLLSCERAVAGLSLATDASERVMGYVSELLAYNEKTNVYSQSAYDKLPFHVADSVTLAMRAGELAERGVLDLGSGSGLPSVLIACVNPELPVYAVESKSRKTRFLSHVARKLELGAYTALTQDVNQLSRAWAFDVDVVTAKAFKPLNEVRPIARRAILGDAARLMVPISEAQVREFELAEEELLRVEGGFIYFSEPITPSHGAAQRKIVTPEAARASRL